MAQNYIPPAHGPGFSPHLVAGNGNVYARALTTDPRINALQDDVNALLNQLHTERMLAEATGYNHNLAFANTVVNPLVAGAAHLAYGQPYPGVPMVPGYPPAPHGQPGAEASAGSKIGKTITETSGYAVAGAIAGAAIGGVATLWGGGWGAVPGAKIGAAIGSGIGLLKNMFFN